VTTKLPSTIETDFENKSTSMPTGTRSFSFDKLTTADLVVDATYEDNATLSAHYIHSGPLARLTGTRNQGGFRITGSVSRPNLVVLYTTLNKPDWPDSIDEENGLFIYFGDNRKPGVELDARPGNQILELAFRLAHGGFSEREQVPPFLVFSKQGVRGRDVVFRGLAVPGANHLRADDDLVAIWKSTGGHRFQNYKAVFTLLNTATASRAWLTELQAGSKLGPNCPDVWRSWVTTGKRKPLMAVRITSVRSKEQQLGASEQMLSIAQAIYEHFKPDPVLFEHLAADIVSLMLPDVVSLDVTRRSRDGGRDGIGRYRIGMTQNRVLVDFAMEAKCYKPNSGVGVEGVSRLISRLRQRQFGVLVTTSFLGEQPYKEIVEDQHPIIVCSGGDIAELLVTKVGVRTADQTREWLSRTYPMRPAAAEADSAPLANKTPAGGVGAAVTEA
jgi:hypothetical protein